MEIEDDAIVSGGVEIPTHMLMKTLDLSPLIVSRTREEQHLALLLALHPEKLKKKFFELYNFLGNPDLGAIARMDEELRERILVEINEVLEIKPFNKNEY